MRLKIELKRIISALFGLALFALSHRVNPSYGMFNDWIIWLGASLCTLSLTKMHATGEATRLYPDDDFRSVRIIYRALYFAILSCSVYVNHIFIDLTQALWSMMLLAINQVLLFHLFFQVWYRESKRNRNWKYSLMISKNLAIFVLIELVLYIITSILVSRHIFI